MGSRYVTHRFALLALVAAALGGTAFGGAALGNAALEGAAAARPVTTASTPPSLDAWWQQPTDLASRDLFNGSWGAEHAPDPGAEYTFVRPKTGGFNPGV